MMTGNPNFASQANINTATTNPTASMSNPLLMNPLMNPLMNQGAAQSNQNSQQPGTAGGTTDKIFDFVALIVNYLYSIVDVISTYNS